MEPSETDGKNKPIGESFESEPCDYVLVPMVETEHLKDTAQVAQYMAEEKGADLLLALPVTYPGQTPHESVDTTEEENTLAQKKQDLEAELGVSVDASVVKGQGNVAGVINRVVKEYPVETVVFEAVHESTLLGKDTTQKILNELTVDTLVVNSRQDASEISSILLPVTEGPHSRFAVGVASVLSTYTNASIDMIHVIEDGDGSWETSRETLDQYSEYTDMDSFDSQIIEQRGVVENIVELSSRYDVTVIGAPTRNRLIRFAMGSDAEKIEKESKNSVIMAMSGEDHN